MPEEEAVGIKADYIDGGSFKTEIGNTTYLVRVFFDNTKQETIEDRVKKFISREVLAGNF